MRRSKLEKQYWNKNALDPQVDKKYICDVNTELCLKDLHPMKGDVLEIGCGVGRLMRKGYYGIDTSLNMLKIARERNPRLKLKVCDGRSIPHEDNKFDYVYSYLVFQHLPKNAVQTYIDEAYRVLKDNGVLVFQFILGTEHEPFSHHYTFKELNEMTSKFDKVGYKLSVAHDQWMIARCYK